MIYFYYFGNGEIMELNSNIVSQPHDKFLYFHCRTSGNPLFLHTNSVFRFFCKVVLVYNTTAAFGIMSAFSWLTGCYSPRSCLQDMIRIETWKWLIFWISIATLQKCHHLEVELADWLLALSTKDTLMLLWCCSSQRNKTDSSGIFIL